MKLILQINQNAINDTSQAWTKYGVMLTPPINEKFWIFRVPVSFEQAVVGFPKMGSIGISFQHETNWNTNLPSDCTDVEIYEHIMCNKGDRKIRRVKCLEAIRMIQDIVLELRRTDAVRQLEAVQSDSDKKEIIGRFLRVTGSPEVAKAFERPELTVSYAVHKHRA